VCKDLAITSQGPGNGRDYWQHCHGSEHTVLFRPYIRHASRKGFESKLFTMTVTLLLSGRAKNEAKRVTFRLSGRALRAIYATNEAIGTFGHTWTAHKGLVKLVTGEAKGHAPKGQKVRSKKYSSLPCSVYLYHVLCDESDLRSTCKSPKECFTYEHKPDCVSRAEWFANWFGSSKQIELN
jgi:hypothetical protein